MMMVMVISSSGVWKCVQFNTNKLWNTDQREMVSAAVQKTPASQRDRKTNL
jgi:hypothetical protein